MFLFVIKYLKFLKIIPGAVLIFDSWLMLWTLITKPDILDYIDEIEKSVLRWNKTKSGLHKYGGLQLNYTTHELGHLHSNGLLDIPLSRKLKEELLKEGRVQHHHTLVNTGWISFYVKTNEDKNYAIKLLKLSYQSSLQRYRHHHP
jgi:hypothetical protein